MLVAVADVHSEREEKRCIGVRGNRTGVGTTGIGSSANLWFDDVGFRVARRHRMKLQDDTE